MDPSQASEIRDQRLQAVLHAYLQAIDASQNPDPQELLRQNPDLADDLSAFFADQAKLDRLAQPFVDQIIPPLAEVTQDPETHGAGSCALPRIRYFGDYELLEEIARGGMGVVYKAKQISLNRMVAIKMILKGELATEAEVHRFRQEAEAAAKLDHPNIVPIYEVGDHEGQQYFTMKLIGPGKRRTDLGAQETARLMSVVAHGVHHAHQRGILHRDLKPSNILFDENGEPHVADFGLAKRTSASPEGEPGNLFTKTGVIVGTASYMAPEQARAEKALTTAVDVYSLGAILYEWLTGQPPLRGENVVATLLMLATEEPTRPRALDANIDGDLETICLKCLEKEPTKRYGSAEALADDLERWSRGEPIQARRAGWLERGAMWARRRPAVAGLLLGLVVVTLAGVLGVLWNWRDAVNAREFADGRVIAEASARKLEEAARHEADKERRKAEVASAGLALDRGIGMCETGEGARGLLWMARALRELPAGHPDLERAIRTNLEAWGRESHALQYGLTIGPKVNALAFLADGKSFLAVGYFRGIQQYDTATGQSIGQPWGADDLGDGICLRVSADGKQALSGHRDGLVVLWDIRTGKPVQKAIQYLGRLHCADLSADGRWIATGGSHPGVSVWDAATGQRIRALDHPDPPYPGGGLTFSDTGVLSLAFAPDGKTLATATQAGMVRFWDLKTGKVHAPILKHVLPVRAVAYSPDGALFLTACEDNFVYLWDAKSGVKIGELNQNGRAVAAAFSRDGRRLVAASNDYRIRVWDVAARQQIAQPMVNAGWIEVAAISPDGSTVLFSSRGEVWVWKTPVNKIHRLPHAKACRALLFSSDSQRIVTAAADGTAAMWNAKTGQRLGLPMLHDDQVYALAFSPDEKSIWTASNDGVIGEWDPMAGKRVGPITRIKIPFEATRPFTMVFHPDRQRILVGGFHHQVLLFDTRTGKQIASLPFEGTYVNTAAIAPDGQSFVTGSWSNFHTTHRWFPGAEPKKPKFPDDPGLVNAPMPHGGAICGLAFSADGSRYLVGVYGTNAARLYDAHTDRPLGPPLEDAAGIAGIALAPDNLTVLTGTHSRHGHGRFWDAIAGKALGPPLPITWGVSVAAISPDGRRAALGSWGFGVDHPADEGTLLVDVPRPLRGEPEQIQRWVEQRTRFRLNGDGTITLLDLGEIEQLKDHLAKSPPFEP